MDPDRASNNLKTTLRGTLLTLGVAALVGCSALGTPKPTPRKAPDTPQPAETVQAESHTWSGSGNGVTEAQDLSANTWAFGWSFAAPRDSSGNLLGCHWEAAVVGANGAAYKREGDLSLVEPKNSGSIKPVRIDPGSFHVEVRTDCTDWKIFLDSTDAT